MRSPFVSEEALVTLTSLLMMRFQVGPFSGSIWAYLKERTIGAVGKKKQAWYRSQGVLPRNEGGGPNGVLVTTSESGLGGFDSASVQTVIHKYLNG